MFKDHDVVVLTENLPAYGLVKGDVGTIVDMFKDGQGFLVEFNDSVGRLVAMEPLAQAQVRKLGKHEVLVPRAKAA
jgi:ATP-dependent exoDNAse (exonuclease V) alpha subunit